MALDRSTGPDTRSSAGPRSPVKLLGQAPKAVTEHMAALSDLQLQLLGTFLEESRELLERLESGLLELDRQGRPGAEIHDIFRAAHSLKGAAGTFGFASVAGLAHSMETLLDGIRTETIEVTPDVTMLLLQAVDRLRDLLSSTSQGHEGPAFSTDANLRASLEDAARCATKAAVKEVSKGTTTAQHASPVAVAGGPGDVSAAHWRIRLRPLPGLLTTGNDPLRLLRELGTLGTLSVSCKADSVPDLPELGTEVCHLRWEASLIGAVQRDAIADVFSWIDGDAEIEIERLNDAPAPDVSAPEPTRSAPRAAEATPATATPSAAEREKGLGTVRVSVEKIEQLMNMVGELVITRSMLSDLDNETPPDAQRLGRLREGLAQLTRNTRLLQESVMRLRSMPVGIIFGRLPRMVHDLGRQLGKDVDLRISGESTELDKTVLEKLGDPLIHLVRNSLDHGIESPSERIAAGKPARGTLSLHGYHRGSGIVIEVSDDGRGLDLTKILNTARKRGLVGPGEVPHDSVLREMIFAPGFSTAASVTDVSGRGVGMDVVRRNIKELGGEISVQSTPGAGTTIALKLPLSLAIVDGQLVRVGAHTYVIPLLSILDLVEVEPKRIGWAEGGRSLYRLSDDFIPLVPLHTLLGEGTAQDGARARMLVVAEADGRRIGLLVDELQSQQQVVVKSLENNFTRVPGLAGATILGDGSVAFILDVTDIKRIAQRQTLPREEGGDAGAPAGPAHSSGEQRRALHG